MRDCQFPKSNDLQVYSEAFRQINQMSVILLDCRCVINIPINFLHPIIFSLQENQYLCTLTYYYMARIYDNIESKFAEGLQSVSSQHECEACELLREILICNK